MQTFRACLRDDAGAISWAAWIDAADLAEATLKAQDLSRAATLTVEMWFATDRRRHAACALDPV